MLMALFLQFNSPGETFVFNAASKVLSSSLKIVFHFIPLFFQKYRQKVTFTIYDDCVDA